MTTVKKKRDGSSNIKVNCSVIHDQKPAQYHVNLMFTPKPGIFKNGTNYNFAPDNPILSMLNILSLF